MERKHYQEEGNNRIFIDLRGQRKIQLINPHDIEVENETALTLDQHVDDGFYTRGIKYHGITYRRLIIGRRGINCVDHSYINVFATGRDGFFHVYILPPKR